MAGALPIPPLPICEATEDSIDDPSIATHTRAIGIIQPPPEIRKIVDITVQHVAKNGPGFEKTIVVNNAIRDVKFSFLTTSDPYHAYYQHRLSEFRSHGKAAPPAKTPASPAQFPTVHKAPNQTLEVEVEQYTVDYPPEGIMEEELDVIKLTAQFVAQNGESFLEGLSRREMNSPKFNFLKPSHSAFKFYTALVDVYSKVLNPPKGLMDKLRNRNVDRAAVLERCLHRAGLEKSQEQARQKAENELDQERVHMAMIDWHDFVVVDAIDFADYEDEELLPVPITLEEVLKRSKISAMEEDKEEVQLVEEGMQAIRFEENDDDIPMRIVKNWKRAEEINQGEIRDTTKLAVSPITGELVLISEMSEHMRISLIDPKFKEQRERMLAKIREASLANDDEISRNIVGLALTRPDIFGTTEEEVSNAVKAVIEKNQHDPMNYDARSFPGPASPPPMQLGVPSVWPLPPLVGLNPPNIPVLHPHGSQFTPLGVHNHFGPAPPLSAGMPMAPPPPKEAPPPLPEEPEPKRQKLDESMLIPEDQFLAQHPGPAQINVSVPNVDGGNLKGQVLEIVVQSLSDTVGSLKERISGEIQLPANKQKLSGKAGFLKDNLSLAYYNMTSGENLTLSLRERGGRKRLSCGGTQASKDLASWQLFQKGQGK